KQCELLMDFGHHLYRKFRRIEPTFWIVGKDLFYPITCRCKEMTAMHAQIRELADMVVAYQADAILNIGEGWKSRPDSEKLASAEASDEADLRHCICVFGLNDHEEFIMLDSDITVEDPE